MPVYIILINKYGQFDYRFWARNPTLFRGRCNDQTNPHQVLYHVAITIRHALIGSSTVSFFGELITRFKTTVSKQDSSPSSQQGCTKNNATPSNHL
jgi:hypothetical protein